MIAVDQHIASVIARSGGKIDGGAEHQCRTVKA